MTTDRPPRSFWIFLGAFFLVWIARATVLFPIDGSFTSERDRLVYSNIVKFVLWVPPAFLYVAHVEKKSPIAFCKMSGVPALPAVARAALVSVVFLALVAARG